MTINEREFQQAFQNIENRLRNIEGTLRRLESQEGKWQMTHGLHPVSTNLSNVREMFLLEILREKGFLQGIDIEKIAAKVRKELAGDDIPWGSDKKSAERHVQSVLHEIADDYAWNSDSE